MSEFTGAQISINFKGTELKTNYREWKDKVEMGLVDASAGADAAETYLKTLLKGDASLKILYQGGTAATDEYLLLTAGANGTLIVGPLGTAAGSPKLTISDAIVKNTERSFKYNDVVELSSDLVFNASAGASYGTF